MKLSKFLLNILKPPIIKIKVKNYSTRINKINHNNSPLIIQQGKLRALQTIYFTPKIKFLDEFERLNQILSSLPPISSNYFYYNNKNKSQNNKLELELKSLLKVLEESYTLLLVPLRYNRKDFEVKTGRIVSHTIRILRLLNKFNQAKELDRAFFSTLDYPLEQSNNIEDSSKKNKFKFSKGIGLNRGKNQISWMQSLALRLEPNLYLTTPATTTSSSTIEVEEEESSTSLKEFDNLLNELKLNNPEKIDIFMISFLLRLLEELLNKSKGKLGLKEYEIIKNLLNDIKESKKFNKDEILIKSIIEIELIKREDSIQGSSYLQSLEYEELSNLVQNLVKNLENESILISPNTSIYNLKPIPDKVNSLFDRSQTLHLTIRFLLIHAKSYSTLEGEDSLQQRQESILRALTSSISLYEKLLNLNLPKVINTNPIRLARMRQRQSSALFRIIHSIITTMDITTSSSNSNSSNSLNNLEILEPIFNSIEFTIKSLNSIKLPNHFPSRAKPFNLIINLKDPRILGIHTDFFRHLLFNLSLPASPLSYSNSQIHQQHTHHQTQVIQRTPWPILKRILLLVLNCRYHDIKYMNSDNSINNNNNNNNAVVVVNSDRLFFRTSFLLHLVRACILGGSHQSTSSSSSTSSFSTSSFSQAAVQIEQGEGEETIQSRLLFFLNFVDELEKTGEKIRKNYVKNAVEEIIRSEFNGLVNIHLRRSLESLLGSWFDRTCDDFVNEEEVEIEPLTIENYQLPRLSPILIPYLPLLNPKLSLLSPHSITRSSKKLKSSKLNSTPLTTTLTTSTSTSTSSTSVHALYPPSATSTSSTSSDSLSY